MRDKPVTIGKLEMGPAAWFERQHSATERRLTPVEKAVLRREIVEPLLKAIEREKGLQLALTQTSFWRQLAPVLAAATALRQLESEEPDVARLAHSLIKAGAAEEVPLPLPAVIASARRHLHGHAA